MKEALWYHTLEDKKVRCILCPHECLIRNNEYGRCEVRQNRDGKLIALNYGKVGGYALDPIEKKPLYNFFPGSYVLSAGARGCSFKCDFCQNWQLVHGKSTEIDVAPFELVSAAERYSESHTHLVSGLAFTYAEPFMWYEFVLDAVEFSRKAGFKNICVTNGFINEKPLKYILPYIDAFNIDVKAFSDDFYKKVAHGRIEPVLRTAEMAKQHNKHVEITTLVIPGYNDSEEEIKNLVKWIYESLGRETPLHFTRYFPNYKFDIKPTPLKTLFGARDIAKESLDYVYLGNVLDADSAATYCPSCGASVISRSGMEPRLIALEGNKCAQCGETLNVVV